MILIVLEPIFLRMMKLLKRLNKLIKKSRNLILNIKEAIFQESINTVDKFNIEINDFKEKVDKLLNDIETIIDLLDITRIESRKFFNAIKLDNKVKVNKNLILSNNSLINELMASLYGITKNETVKFYSFDDSTPLIRRKFEYYRSKYL